MVIADARVYSGVPEELFVLPTIVPLQPRSNISVLSALLLAQAPPSCLLNEVAPLTVAEVGRG